jgi:hypothetical protein
MVALIVLTFGIRSLFLSKRRPNVLQTLLHGGTVREIVLSPLREAQISIWPAAHEICVVVILTVVFPETYRAYVIPASLA